MMKLKTYMITAAAILLMTLTCTISAFAEETAGADTKTTVSETITVGEYKNNAAAKKETKRDTVSEEADTSVSANEQPAEEADNEKQAAATGLRSLGVFRTTAYCPCYGCSEGYGRHTCTGAIAKANHTIAVDPRVIPYGSKVVINGTVYTAEDRGGGVKGNHIDIFYDTHAQTRQYGSRHVEVFLIG